MKPLSNLNAASMKRIGATMNMKSKSAQMGEEPPSEIGEAEVNALPSAVEKTIDTLYDIKYELLGIDGDVLSDYTIEVVDGMYKQLDALLNLNEGELFNNRAWGE